MCTNQFLAIALRCGDMINHTLLRSKRAGLVACGFITVGGLLWGGRKAYTWHQQLGQDRRDNKTASAIIDDPVQVDDASSLLVGEESSSKLLPHSRRGRRQYYMEVVAKVKIVMGTPQRTAANVLVARRIARQSMEEHKLRPTHIAQCLPLIIEAVFVESKHERAARTWGERLKAQRESWFNWSNPVEPSI